MGGGVPTFFLDPYSLYPGQNLDIIFTLLYYQCAYVTSWCVWRTSIPLDLHTLVYVQRYIEIQTINAPCVDASHPSARGDMADSNPLFLEKRHTLCSSPFFYFREVKKIIPDIPSNLNHEILLTSNCRFLINRNNAWTKKQSYQLQSRRSPCRTTIISISVVMSPNIYEESHQIGRKKASSNSKKQQNDHLQSEMNYGRDLRLIKAKK